jgi:pimeloyl-ACP methyl ester carboxylesterase
MKHPELLWKLCAMQVPPIAVWKRNQTAKQLFASWYMFFFQLPYLPEFVIRMNDFGLLAKALKEDPAVPVIDDNDIAEYKKVWSQPGAMTAMLNYYRANILKRLFSSGEKEPQKITVPTLFIYAANDKAVLPETVEGVGDFVEAPYHEHRLPGVSHWVQQEARVEVSQMLRTFLAE